MSRQRSMEKILASEYVSIGELVRIMAQKELPYCIAGTT